MKANSLPSVLVALGSGSGSADPDADLLARFVSARDQSAFAELVRRYSRLVWRVARTRCRTTPAAEDVFQAAFVVLSRKGGSIRTGAALAGWLHRTAHRLAVRAAKKERPAVPLPAQLPTSADPLDALTARELFAAVDDEMAKLSDTERAVLVLCGIDGLANDEAARRLGVTPGSVKGRLERARVKLRARLDARGLTVPAVALGLIGGPSAAAVQAAFTIPFGGAIPPGVERLIAEGLSMKGTMTKAVGVLALVAAIAGLSGRGPAPQATAAPVPKKEAEHVLLLTSSDEDKPLEVVKPDGTAGKAVKAALNKPFNWRLSPEGKRAAGVVEVEQRQDAKTKIWNQFDVQTLDLEAKDAKPKTILEGVFQPFVHWSGDGKSLVVSHIDPDAFDDSEKPGTTVRFQTWVYTLADGKKTRLKLPPEHLVLDVSRDGKTLLTETVVSGTYELTLYATPADTLKPVRVSEPTQHNLYAVLSPDGGSVLLNVQPGEPKVAPGNALYLLNLGTKKETRIGLPGEVVFGVQRMAFSPDGKRIAFQWWETAPPPPGMPVPVGPNGRAEVPVERVSVCDADGSNPQVVVKRGYGQQINGLDWGEVRDAVPPADTRRKNAPVPKAAEAEKLVVWSERFDAKDGFVVSHGIWAPDGKHVLVVGQMPGAKFGDERGEVRVLAADTGKLVHTHRGTLSFNTWRRNVAVTPDGKTVAVAARTGNQLASALELFDWGTEKPRASVKLNTVPSAVAVSPDGKAVVTLDLIGDLTARDLKTEKLLWTTALGRDVNWGLTYWNDGKELLVVGESGNMRRFDAATGKEVAAFGKFNVTLYAWSVADNGKRIAFNDFAEKGPLVLDCEDGKAGERRGLDLTGKVRAGATGLSADGKYLAVGCADKSLKVFDAATGKLLAEEKEQAGVVLSVRYSPDGKRLLTVGPDAVKVWSVKELMKAK